MSAEELKNFHGPKGFTAAVKEVIEKSVGEHDENPVADYLRGYLVSLCKEVEIDDKLLEELEDDAAAWADGWNYCKAWIRTCGKTTVLADEGEDYECYLVPKSQVEE